MIYAIERAVSGVRGRWRRNVLVIVAVALSAASFVLMLALSLGSSDAVLRSLGDGETSRVQLALPSTAWQAKENTLLHELLSADGVFGGGTLTSSDATGVTVVLTSAARSSPLNTAVAVATNEGLQSRDIDWIEGHDFPSATVLRADPRQIVLGARVARDLGVSARPGDNQVSVNGSNASVVGIISETGDSALLTAAAVVPPELIPLLTSDLPARVIDLTVRAEMSSWVVSQAPTAVWPQEPAAVSATAPADPRQLRDRLEAETQGLITAVTWVMVGVSVFVIANTMQIAIGERRREIGVSRAFGISPMSIGFQFFLEASILGLVGSLAGALLGALIASATTMILGWDLVLPLAVVIVPGAGLILGGVGGLVPAWIASRVRPLELLRAP